VCVFYYPHFYGLVFNNMEIVCHTDIFYNTKGLGNKRLKYGFNFYCNFELLILLVPETMYLGCLCVIP
jgi:hypothetical protein